MKGFSITIGTFFTAALVFYLCEMKDTAQYIAAFGLVALFVSLPKAAAWVQNQKGA